MDGRTYVRMYIHLKSGKWYEHVLKWLLERFHHRASDKYPGNGSRSPNQQLFAGLWQRQIPNLQAFQHLQALGILIRKQQCDGARSLTPRNYTNQSKQIGGKGQCMAFYMSVCLQFTLIHFCETIFVNSKPLLASSLLLKLIFTPISAAAIWAAALPSAKSSGSSRSLPLDFLHSCVQ